jgi:Uma2 family endonuclease
MTTSVLKGSIEEPKVSLRKLTINEYHKLGEAGILHPNDRVELIDGLLVQMAPIGPEHQFILEKLNDLFSEQKKGRFKVGPGRPIPIPDFNEPQPDLVLFRTDAGTRSQHASPLEIYLVIEISDTTLKYDAEKKFLAYENARIPEHWIIDIPGRAVRVFRLNQEKKYQKTRFTEGSIAVLAYPDVIVRLEDLFLMPQRAEPGFAQ